MGIKNRKCEQGKEYTMPNDELEKKWNEIVQQAFHTFIQENVGYQEKSDQPVCYGTGDNKSYCQVCPFQKTC